jgi:hypothetical protein
MNPQTIIAVANLVCATFSFVYFVGALFISREPSFHNIDAISNYRDQRPFDGIEDDAETLNETASLIDSLAPVHFKHYYEEVVKPLIISIVLTFVRHLTCPYRRAQLTPP